MNDAPQGTALAPRHKSLVEKFAARYTIEPNRLLDILKATAFKLSSPEKQVSNEQMAALLVVADQYGLNPFTREIFAFEDKFKGIVPVVSVDGWARIINERTELDGLEFVDPGKTVAALHGGKQAFEWLECVIYRKDRKHPTRVREYLEEVYQGPRGQNATNGPWQSHPRRMHRHKALIQCARLAFGFAGIYDEDEAQRIIETGAIIEGEVISSTTSNSATDRMREHLGGKVEKEAAKPPKGGVTAAGLDLDIEGAADKGDLGSILDKIMTLKDTPERAELLKKWNAKSRAMAPADDDGVIDNPVAEIKSDVPWEKPVKAEAPKPGPAKPAAKAEPKAAAPAKAPEPEKPAATIGKTEKPVGTEADADEFMQSFGAASNPEELDNAADAANAYRWPRKLQGELNTAYMKRSEELQAK